MTVSKKSSLPVRRASVASPHERSEPYLRSTIAHASCVRSARSKHICHVVSWCRRLAQAPPERTLRETLRIDGNTELFSTISTAYVARNGTIAIPSWKESQFLLYNAQGKRLTTFGRQGAGPGEWGSSSRPQNSTSENREATLRSLKTASWYLNETAHYARPRFSFRQRRSWCEQWSEASVLERAPLGGHARELPTIARRHAQRARARNQKAAPQKLPAASRELRWRRWYRLAQSGESAGPVSVVVNKCLWRTLGRFHNANGRHAGLEERRYDPGQ